jgi:type IV pilus assembly protein PilE
MNRRNRGFSLIELLITVAVAAVIVAVAIPSYRNYVMRASRADATGALLRLAANQERFYLANNTYAGDDQMADAPPAGLGISGTERGFYELEIAPHADGLQVGYTATATAVAGEDQAADVDCAVFSVNEQGLRKAEDSGGTDNTERCWR